MTKKRIVINGRFLTQNVSGVQRYSIEVVKAIDHLLSANNSHEVILAYPKKDQLVTKLDLRNIKPFPCGFLKGHLWEQVELPRYTQELLVCLGNTAPFFTLWRGNVLSVVHDLSYKYFPDAYSLAFRTLYNFLIPVVLRKSKAVFTVSNSEKASMEKHYPFTKGKILVGHCGGFSPDVQRYIAKKRSVIAKKRDIFIYVGSLNPRKNLIGFLSAFEKIQSGNNYKAYVIGGGDKVFADYQLRRFQSNPRIKFLGQINDPKVIADHLLEAHSLVFPSFYEASPIPPIEAMNCGCTVIASDIPSLKERCGEAALFCDANQGDTIAGRMQELISDKGLHARLQQQGWENAEKFTWERTAKSLWEEAMKIK